MSPKKLRALAKRARTRPLFAASVPKEAVMLTWDEAQLLAQAAETLADRLDEGKKAR